MLENVGVVQRRLSEAAKKRLKTGRMLLAGKSFAEAASAVGVTRQTVYTWKRLLDEGDIDALRGVPERGRSAQLDEQQLAAVAHSGPSVGQTSESRPRFFSRYST